MANYDAEAGREYAEAVHGLLNPIPHAPIEPPEWLVKQGKRHDNSGLIVIVVSIVVFMFGFLSVAGSVLLAIGGG